jgi:hypothetical protein
MIRSMGMDNINILMKQNIMANGKKILEKGMEHIIIQMEIVMKVIGIMTYKVE